MEGRREVFCGIPFQNMFGNTAQRASGDFARHLLANFPSYFTKITPLFVSSDEKFDDASVAQSLCGIAVRFHRETPLPNWNKTEFLSLSHK